MGGWAGTPLHVTSPPILPTLLRVVGCLTSPTTINSIWVSSCVNFEFSLGQAGVTGG